MDDTQLNWVAELFITHQVQEIHGWTFEQFVRGYQAGMVDHLLEDVA